MEKSRAKLDAAAGLGHEQHRRAQVRDALEALLQLADQRRAAQRGERQRRLRLLSAVLESAPDGGEQFLQRNRLFEEIVGADARVASTAVSMVPWPDIITTGIVSSPALAHSLRSVMPSVSGIQMSSSTRSGRVLLRKARASLAFSASLTW